MNEIIRLKEEDKLIDNIVKIDLDRNLAPREQETEKRNILIQDAEDHGCSHVIVIDSDEYYTKKAFERGLDIIDEKDAECSYCQYCNYGINYRSFLVYPFKDGMFVPFVSKVKYRHQFDCKDFTRPSDPTRRYVLPYDGYTTVKDQRGNPIQIKKYTVEPLIFDWETVHMHHLSWLRANIRKKLENWSSKTVFKDYDDLIDQAVYSFEHYDESKATGHLKMLFNTPGNMVDVTTLPKQYIHPRVDYKTRLRPAKDYKKILFLSMSANLPLFNKMEEVCNETWRNYDKKKYPDVNADFWTYTDAKEGEETHIDEKNHIIYIKLDTSHQTPLDATYSKTIEAMYIIKDKLKLEFDYMVRTNNSTWINVPLVNDFLAYNHDDSKIYASKLYAAFWSAFNVYAGGQFYILSKRNFNIMLKLCGTVAEAKAFERNISGCDDNIMCGKWNQRLIRLGLPYNDSYHSLGGADLIDEKIDFSKIDFTLPCYQIKTYSDDETRMRLDPPKMRAIDNVWRKSNLSIDDLYKKMMSEHYDKELTILPYNKTQWISLDDSIKATVKYNTDFIHERMEGLKFLSTYQAQNGYRGGIFL